MVQEALTNVHRHAGAKHVSILLEALENELIVIVEDDGVGFKPESKRHRRAPKNPRVAQRRDSTRNSGAQAISSERLGLLGMRERMDLIGGTLTVESKVGNGTTIYAHAHRAQTAHTRLIVFQNCFS